MKQELQQIKQLTVQHLVEQLEASNDELTKPDVITESQWMRMTKKERVRSIFYWGEPHE